jgi:hypothetical protein
MPAAESRNISGIAQQDGSIPALLFAKTNTHADAGYYQRPCEMILSRMVFVNPEEMEINGSIFVPLVMQ